MNEEFYAALDDSLDLIEEQEELLPEEDYNLTAL